MQHRYVCYVYVRLDKHTQMIQLGKVIPTTNYV